MTVTTAPSDRFRSIFESAAARAAETATFADTAKVVVLRNITVEGFDTLLQHHLFDQRIRSSVEFGGYGTMLQDVLDPAGPVARLRPDVVMLFLALEEFDSAYGAPGWTCDAVRNELESLFEQLALQSRATVVVHTFLPPPYAETGLVVDSHGRDVASQVDALNRFVGGQVQQRAPQFVLADWQRSLLRLGIDNALDARARYVWRAPFRRPFLDEQARHLARVIFALKGRVKKVLVLDCDNTLWGGVIGEDGLDGIALDPNQYPGRAFFDFHATVLQLGERGVLIALCSKNEEADVFDVLDRHPACRLKRSHLSAWRINWQDKASNLRELADELNLGLDAFVFVDDSDVECGLVRQILPQVTVIQVPKRLHELPPLLLQAGHFDTLAVTDEDRQRAKLYQGEAQRKGERASHASMDDYLASLQTVARLRRGDPRDLARIAQLTQKTNQFNLTTHRYSEPQIAAMAADPAWAVYGLSVDDRFGTLGLVGVLLVRSEGDVGIIDTLLMSCRALGRRIEDAMVDACLGALAAERGIVRWEAEYLPTRKNAQVAGFWDRLGFDRVADDGEGGRRYTRPAALPLPVSIAHIAIERS